MFDGPSMPFTNELSALDAFTEAGTTTGYLGPNDFLTFIKNAESGVRERGMFEGRGPLAILLIMGGIFSFLPVLGLWMLPLGLLLFAQDVPFLQKPIAGTLGWVERKWIERQRAKDMR